MSTSSKVLNYPGAGTGHSVSVPALLWNVQCDRGQVEGGVRGDAQKEAYPIGKRVSQLQEGLWSYCVRPLSHLDHELWGLA